MLTKREIMSTSKPNIMSTKYNIAVAILAGGKSKRMGTDKAELVRKDGETFLEHICKEMSPFAKKYLSVNKEQKYAFEGYETIVDKYDGIGPIGAIAGVLEKAKADGMDAVLFVACDMPFYSYAHAMKTVDIYSGEDVVLPVVENRAEPLAAIYSVNILETVYENIRCNEYKLTDVIKKMHYREYVPDDYEAYSNINTKMEFDNLK